jgi:CubicO group peptidase (beta-lactamase class C family)
VRYLVIVCILASIGFDGAVATAQSSQATDSLAEERVVGPLGLALDRQLTRFAEYGFSGSVLVARDGQVVLLKGYGLADVERGIPNTPATRFEMNSMTKMFTGVGVLQLEAAGRLRVTDSLPKYFGTFPADKRATTIEQLASHTAGLVVAGAPLSTESRDAFIRDIIRTPRASPPGAAYRYTNAGFSMLAALIEIVSGSSYEKYLQERLFTPAGMTSAIFRDEVPDDEVRFARGYVGTPASLQRGPPNPYVWGTRGAGGVWSTVGDIYRWIVAIESGTLLDSAGRARLFAPHRSPALEAFGWHVERTPKGRSLVQKGGSSSDFASHMLYYPADRIVIVWATNNLRQRWRRTLNLAIPQVVFGDSAMTLPHVRRVAPPALTLRAGRYVRGQQSLDLRAAKGYLYVADSSFGVPANVMFYNTGDGEYTGFDPATGEQTRLRFGRGGALLVELAGGKRVALSHSS